MTCESISSWNWASSQSDRVLSAWLFAAWFEFDGARPAKLGFKWLFDCLPDHFIYFCSFSFSIFSFTIGSTLCYRPIEMGLLKRSEMLVVIIYNMLLGRQLWFRIFFIYFYFLVNGGLLIVYVIWLVWRQTHVSSCNSNFRTSFSDTIFNPDVTILTLVLQHHHRQASWICVTIIVVQVMAVALLSLVDSKIVSLAHGEQWSFPVGIVVNILSLVTLQYCNIIITLYYTLICAVGFRASLVCS